MHITLDQLSLGQTAVVEAVDSLDDSMTRLMELGLVPGAMVTLERVSPFGCPLSIRLKGSSIAIRKRDASAVRLISLLKPA